MKSYVQNFVGQRIISYSDAPSVYQTLTSGNGALIFNVGFDSNTRNRKEEHNHSFTKTFYQNYFGEQYNYQAQAQAGTPSGWSKISGANVFSFSRLPSAGYSTELYNELLSRINDRIRGDVDLAIDLAESKKTYNMVAQAIRSLNNFKDTFDRIKRANPRDAGSLFLQHKYGWSPTAKTLYSALQKAMNPDEEWISVNVKANRVRTQQSVFPFDGSVKEVCDYLYRERIKAELVYAIKPSALSALAGYASLNPASLLWELTPYSFVADWFVDFGGYLRNLESAAIYSQYFKRGYIVRGYKNTVKSYIAGTNDLGGGSYSEYSLKANAFVSGKNRSVLTGAPPLPALPSFDPKLGASRLLSAASLLSQQIKSWEVRLPREHRFRGAR